MADESELPEAGGESVADEVRTAPRQVAAEERAELDFDVIVRETHPHIRAYIAGMGVPRHDVDDVAQDVYVELYRFADNIPAGVHPKQWLKGIARNLCLNYFRKQGRRQRLQREAMVEI